MSTCVVWTLPCEHIGDAISNSLKLETAPTVWGVALDEIGNNICFIIEVDPDELEKAKAELDILELEDCGLEN